VIGLVYFGALALAVYAVFVVWPASPCLTGGLLLIAASIYGWSAVLHRPVQTVEQSVLLLERRRGPVTALALLFAVLVMGAIIWFLYGGGR